MKPTVVVTGAGGFLGRRLCPALEKDWRVVKVVSPRSGMDGPDVYRADLTDAASAGSLAEDIIRRGQGCPPEALVHLAAVLCPPGRWRDLAVYEANSSLTRNTAELARRIAPRALVNFSSLAVYPVRDGVFDEDSAPDPSANTEGLYGLAKFDSEILFRFLLGKDMAVVNLRLTQAYGPGMQQDRLVALLAGEWRETGKITLFGEGRRVSNFIHSNDVILGLKAVLKAPQAGTYNMGCSRNLSYLELGRHVLAALGAGEDALVLEKMGITAQAAISTARFEEAFGIRLAEVDFSFLAGEVHP
jgi:nucleoside-diphosphate-sugar epimerase